LIKLFVQSEQYYVQVSLYFDWLYYHWCLKRRPYFHFNFFLFSEYQCQTFAWIRSCCSSRMHWLWEKVHYGWPYMVCPYPWSRMGSIYYRRCEPYEIQLSCLRTHIRYIEYNIRGMCVFARPIYLEQCGYYYMVYLCVPNQCFKNRTGHQITEP